MSSQAKRLHETSESDTDNETADSSTSKTKKKKKAPTQTFRPHYSEKYRVLTRSEKGAEFAHCSVCSCDFTIRHGGINDCKRHCESKAHVDKCVPHPTSTTKAITNYFTQKPKESGPTVEQVTRAETMMVELLTELNLPFTSADKFTEAFPKMFPDSQIAAKFACGRSKATAVVKKLSNGFQEELIMRMKNDPFTISTDGSQDTREKLFPLVVRTVDQETGQVHSELLSVPALSDRATGENIFKLIDDVMTDHDSEGREVVKIPWKNCLALGCDNCNVMVGKKAGVYAFMTKKHGNVYLAGCVCHLIHIAAQKASSELSLKIDEVLVDVYYYLDKSSKRLEELKNIQLHHDVKATRILKHVPTRWLSVRTCLPRLLENWGALKEFFQKERQERKQKTNSQADRLERLYTVFSSQTSKLYCMFLNSALQVFDDQNLVLQCEEPKIHLLRRTIFKLQRTLYERYLKSVALSNKGGELLREVKFEQAYHHKADENLTIGDDAREFINNTSSLRPEKVKKFYMEVKQFFMTASAYINKSFPLGSDHVLLKHAEVVDPNVVRTKMQNDAEATTPVPDKDSHLESIKYFLQKYPALIPPGGSADNILLEFSRFQTHIFESLPDQNETGRIDDFWQSVKDLRDETGCEKFPHLPSFMQGILTIPHSSAHCERIFSLVRKNRTETRASMSQETLESLLVLKSVGKQERVYTNVQLQELKSCYKESLKKKD